MAQNRKLSQTEVRLYRVTNSQPEIFNVELAARPTYVALRDIIRKHLGPVNFERVQVMHPDTPRTKMIDMLVDKDGKPKGLPVNEAATTLFRAYYLHSLPGTKPEDLQSIVGDALLFMRRVWY